MADVPSATAALGAMLLLAACSPEPPAAGELEHYIEGFTQLPYTPKTRKVDILVVFDNSSSMGEEQALLAQNLSPLIEVLEAEDVEADYRIAFTTTDAGHPACPGSTPEAGAFMLTPCTDRLDEFVADGEGGSSDVRALACTDICELDAADLEIQPTIAFPNDTPAPRPWLEHANGRTNLPEGVEMADAIRCFAPQGVAGCDFEMPLESMYRALMRSQDASDPAYGFMRKDAILLVVIVTDEDDCSPAPGAEEIFAKDGDKLYWSDPDADVPTSAVCWNAGVACEGDPSDFDSCDPVNKDLAGNEGVADADAVLQPISRYVGLLEGIMAEKREIDPYAQPIISIVGGASADGKLYFGEVGDTDPEFQQTYGIGPGCTAPPSTDSDRPIRATPPVRLQAVQTDSFGLGSMYSVCHQDWTPALEVIAERLLYQIRPGCFSHCALDTDDSTTIVEPDCNVVEETPDVGRRYIEECLRDETGYLIDPETQDYQPPPDVDVCYAALTDWYGSTPNINDDMSPECVDRGMNLEFKISRRPGHPALPGTRVTVTCLLDDWPSTRCPGLYD